MRKGKRGEEGGKRCEWEEMGRGGEEERSGDSPAEGEEEGEREGAAGLTGRRAGGESLKESVRVQA